MSTLVYKLYLMGAGLTYYPDSTSSNAGPVPVCTGSKSKVSFSDPDNEVSISEMRISLYGLSFRRKLYDPGNIQAELLIQTPSKVKLSVSVVTTFLLNREVKLTVPVDSVETDIATKYYIYEISPQFATKDDCNFVYVKLDIFSKDKLLTLNKFSQAHLGKTLIGDIVTKFVGNAAINVSLRDSNVLQNLAYKNGTDQVEFVHPYLVQYNESFHDFLKRTANRCGEAFYFEGGQLCFGLKELKQDETATPIANARSVTFQRISGAPLSVRDYTRDPLKQRRSDFDASKAVTEDTQDFLEDDKILTDAIPTNGDFPSDAFPEEETTAGNLSEVYNSETAPEEQYMILYKNKFARDGWTGTYWGDTAEHLMPVVSDILNSTSLLELLSKYLAKITTGLIKASKKIDKINKDGNKLIKDTKPDGQEKYAVLFAGIDNDTNHWISVKRYHDIRCQEEDLARKTVCVDMGSGFQNVSLGERITIPEDSGTTYIVIQIDISSSSEWVNSYEGFSSSSNLSAGRQSQRIYAIPMTPGDDKGNNKKFYPPLLPGKPFCYSGPQPAFITAAGDPMNQGRVRIRFPWQPAYKDIDKKVDASPWIRMATPMATKGGGMYFKPEVGDEVMVDFENGNIERPYVVGTLYSKNVPAPDDGNRVIVSPNGHTIKFIDPTNADDFVASAYPGIKYLQSVGVKFDKWEVGDKSKQLLGGIEFTDRYGFYNVKMSSGDRSISIASPFGDVSMSALTGISIEAPNGDISIKGKNVEISAFNTISIESGKNVEKGRGGLFSDFGNAKSWGKAMAKIILNPTIGKFFDLSLLRTLLEIIVRPIDGTLNISSGRYLKLQAGEGNTATASESRYDLHFYDYAQFGNEAIVLVELMPWIKEKLDGFIEGYAPLFDKVVEGIGKFKDADFGTNPPAFLSTPATRLDLVKAVFALPIYNTEDNLVNGQNDFCDEAKNHIAFVPLPVNVPQDVKRAFNNEIKGLIKDLMRAINDLRKYIAGYDHLFDSPSGSFGRLLHISRFYSQYYAGATFATGALTIIKLDNPMIPSPAVAAAGNPSPTTVAPGQQVAEQGFYGENLKKVNDIANSNDLNLFASVFDKSAYEEWKKIVCRRLMCLAIEGCRGTNSHFNTFTIPAAVYNPTIDYTTLATTSVTPVCQTHPFSDTDWPLYVQEIDFKEKDRGNMSDGEQFARAFGAGAVDILAKKLNPLPELIEAGVWKSDAVGEILFSDQKNKTYQFKNGGVAVHDNISRELAADKDAMKDSMK